MSQTDQQGQVAQYLSFELAGAEYGVGILSVKEILQYETITPVPSVPRSVRGVINLRGCVVPVIDLAAKFGLDETVVTPRTCILIMEVKLDDRPTVMGLMADAVREVIELGPQDIEAPPAFGTRVKVEHLVGMGKASGKRFVLLLDVDRVVSADEQEFAEPAAEAPPPAPSVETLADAPA
jgi:purine-binding chemotaxis protein CheW